MQLSKNINDNEKNIACNCGCGFKKLTPTLIEMIQDVRDYFEKPVSFNSTCRCKKHNKNVGGSKASFHLPDIYYKEMSRASDIRVKDTNPLEVYNYLDKKYPNSIGLGLYNGRVHLDDRVKKARWDMTK